MNFVIETTGDVVERQELLNGTQIVTIEGTSADGRWAISGLFSWNIGLSTNTGEGDITLSRGDGAELFGTLAAGDVTETEDGTIPFTLEYDIDGGAAEFESTSGRASASGAIAADRFEARWTITLQ